MMTGHNATSWAYAPYPSYSIKSCPFCPKGQGEIIDTSSGSMVRCHNCHSCSPVCNSRLEAIDMWNSRSFPSWRWTADDPIEVGKYVVSTRERRLEVAVIEAKNTGKLRIRYFDEALETTVTATIEDFKKTLNEYGNFRWFKIEIPDCHPDYAKAQEKTAD